MKRLFARPIGWIWSTGHRTRRAWPDGCYISFFRRSRSGEMAPCAPCGHRGARGRHGADCCGSRGLILCVPLHVRVIADPILDILCSEPKISTVGVLRIDTPEALSNGSRRDGNDMMMNDSRVTTDVRPVFTIAKVDPVPLAARIDACRSPDHDSPRRCCARWHRRQVNAM